MKRSQSWRDQNELRYPLDRRQAAALLDVLRGESSEIVYTPGSSTTLVITTYLDTPEGHYYRRATASGAGSIKLRVREYVPLSDSDRSPLAISDQCYVERKERTGVLRVKERVRLDKDAARSFVDGLGDELGDSVEADAIRSEIDGKTLVPAVVSVYERRVWGDDGDLRITFDERLRFFDPQGSLFDARSVAPERFEQPVGIGPKRILEIKHPLDSRLPAWLQRSIDRLGNLSGYSKFRDGMKVLRSRDPGGAPLTRPLLLPEDS